MASARSRSALQRLTTRLSGMAVLAAALVATTTPAAAEPRPAPGGTVDFHTRLQAIDGFGFSEAFQRSAILHGSRGLPPERQREVLDLLFSPHTGAGASILRLGIGSSADGGYDHMRSIQPTDPGGPDAPPRYEWDGDDHGQVWLAQQARSYGVRRIYADAWSAPGYMKTNGDDAHGGTLCGLPGTACASGDWRQAYANYLVQYAKFYAAEGVPITDLGFVNEPDLATSYASMQVTPEQAADLAKVLGPTLARSGLRASVVCCDAVGWRTQAGYTTAIEADPEAARWVRTHTGHAYGSPAASPLPTQRPVWMSEWGPSGDRWNEAWDDGSASSGMAVAEHVHQTLAEGNASAYLFWYGASVGATRALIQLDGANYHVSKRLWALAGYSRFIRPGAVRVPATATDAALKVSAYRNADGTRVIEIINTSTAPLRTSFELTGAGGGRATAHVTDNDRSLTPSNVARRSGNTLTVDLAARSLTTVTLGRG